ncbi:MAG: hypothetical protein AAF827_03880 [Cyanobacteria bacterium P01_D01_bin.6]
MFDLLLPGQPGFNQILATPPPDPRQGVAYVQRVDSPVMEAVELSELDEYMLGGEYGERLEQIEIEDAQATEIPINQGLKSSVLYLPCSVVV